MTHPAKYPLRGEDHILPDNRILLDLPIDPGNESRRGSGLRKHIRAHQDRPNGRKLVKRLGIEELSARLLWKLEKAARQVIPDCIAEDVLRGLLGRDVAALAGGDEDELSLCLLAMDTWTEGAVGRDLPPSLEDARRRNG